MAYGPSRNVDDDILTLPKTRDLAFAPAFGRGLTCRMVSKLKVSPFQRVNSPLEAPVMSRRPSGVQARLKIGHRILLVEVRMNLVVTALIGLSRKKRGGTN